MIKNLAKCDVKINNELIVVSTEVYLYNPDTDVLTEINPHFVTFSNLNDAEFLEILLGIEYPEPMLTFIENELIQEYFEM